MPKTKASMPNDKQPVKAKKRGARGRGRTDDERVAVLEADLPRLRDRAEAQLIHAVSRAELFVRTQFQPLQQALLSALSLQKGPLKDSPFMRLTKIVQLR